MKLKYSESAEIVFKKISQNTSLKNEDIIHDSDRSFVKDLAAFLSEEYSSDEKAAEKILSMSKNGCFTSTGIGGSSNIRISAELCKCIGEKWPLASAILIACSVPDFKVDSSARYYYHNVFKGYSKICEPSLLLLEAANKIIFAELSANYSDSQNSNSKYLRNIIFLARKISNSLTNDSAKYNPDDFGRYVNATSHLTRLSVGYICKYPKEFSNMVFIMRKMVLDSRADESDFYQVSEFLYDNASISPILGLSLWEMLRNIDAVFKEHADISTDLPGESEAFLVAKEYIVNLLLKALSLNQDDLRIFACLPDLKKQGNLTFIGKGERHPIAIYLDNFKRQVDASNVEKGLRETAYTNLLGAVTSWIALPAEKSAKKHSKDILNQVFGYAKIENAIPFITDEGKKILACYVVDEHPSLVRMLPESVKVFAFESSLGL